MRASKSTTWARLSSIKMLPGVLRSRRDTLFARRVQAVLSLFYANLSAREGVEPDKGVLVRSRTVFCAGFGLSVFIYFGFRLDILDQFFLSYVKTTTIYTHVLNRGGKGVKGTVDDL